MEIAVGTKLRWLNVDHGRKITEVLAIRIILNPITKVWETSVTVQNEDHPVTLGMDHLARCFASKGLEVLQ
jgi:hypothetical protein